jgi:hypothetical protein
MRDPGRAAPAGALADRLRGAERDGFVGRAGELELFSAALPEGAGSFAVLFVHGPGGVGKTALLRRLSLEAERAGAEPVLLDGRDAPPSPAGFTSALAGALGLPADADPVAALHDRGRPVLLLDSFERCAGLQTWLRTEFLPRLPVEALTVVAGRRPPDAAWRLDPAWQDLLRVVTLRDLPREDAVALLDRRGVDRSLHEQALAATGGHPLALCLVAELVRAGGPVAPVPDAASPDVVRVLLARFADEASTARQRAALELCAHARVTTETLLRDVLDDPAAGELFDWLRDRSFVEESGAGLHPHDLARDVLDRELRWRDPERYAAMHARLRGHLVARMAAPAVDPLRSWADLMFLHRRNPAMAPFLTWEVDTGVYEDAYRPGDRPAVLAMTEAAEGPESAAICAWWLDRQPEACRVYRRGGAADPAGFALELRLQAPEPADLARDPVVAAVWAHVRTRPPLRPGEHVEVLRTFVVPGAYHRPSPVMDLIQVRCALGWTRPPQPAVSVLVLADPQFWAGQMAYIDHLPAGQARTDGRTFTLFAHDWRLVPFHDWLAVLQSRELGAEPAPARAGAPPRAVLAEEDFATAVKDALRCWRRPDDLARNPLLRSRVVADVRGVPPAQALVDLLVAATDALAEDPRDARLHRAVATTFFKGVPTQEAAAQRLDLPFSTYRRHLAAGVDRVVAWLWDREVSGPGGS